MILYLVRYTQKGTDPRKDLKQVHLEYLRELYESGKLLAAGLFQGKPGGYLLFQTDTYEECRQWIEKDPYIIYDARNYEIEAWDTSPFPLRV